MKGTKMELTYSSNGTKNGPGATAMTTVFVATDAT